MQRAGALLLAACMLASTGQACAQALSQTVYADRAPSSLTFTIPVTASVGGVCGFTDGHAPTGSYDAGNIDTDTWTHDFAFQILCTVPSRVAVVSSHGGLLAAAATTAPGYTNLAPYGVTLNLQGTSTSVTAGCSAETLSATAATPCSWRGPSSSTNGLRLNDTSLSANGTYLRVNAPAYNTAYPTGNALVSGAYADTLTITISAAP